MAISFKEQIDNFSNDFYINTAYIPYIVNGPECADGLSADELKKIDDFLDKWSYVDCSEAMLFFPDSLFIDKSGLSHRCLHTADTAFTEVR